MANLLKMQKNFVAEDGKIFFRMGEYEYEEWFEGIRPDSCDIDEECLGLYIKYYKVRVNDTVYSIPETHVVLIDKHTNSDFKEGFAKAWHDKVTRDAIRDIYPVEDYVKAGKEFLGIDISAKKRSDKADYAQESRVKEILQKKYGNNLPDGTDVTAKEGL